MWEILGKEALYVEFADVFKERITELAEGVENSEKFIELMKESEVTHIFNGTTETHAFTIFPDKNLSPEDIQYMVEIILAIANLDTERYFIAIDGKYQKCVVNIRTDDEPELIGKDKTEGFASGKIFNPILESLCKPGRGNDSMM